MSARGFGNQLLVVVIAGLALVAAPMMRFVLPEQFLLDDEHLRHSIAGSLLTGDAEGFRVTAAFYEALGLASSPTAAAVAAIALFTVAVMAAVGWERLRDQSVLGLAAVACSFVLALVYMAQYSKELFTLVVVTVTLLAPRSRWGDVAVLAACLGYAGTIRSYWFLVAALYLVWRVALRRWRSPLVLVLVPLVVYITLTPAFSLALDGAGLQSQREWANAERASTGEIASQITSPFPGATGALGVLSALIMLLLLMVPVPLLTSGTPYQMASGLLIAGIWGVALWPVLRGHLAERPRAVRIQAVRAAPLLLALLTVQSLFEPDYGSYLKHLTPMLPLALALLPASSRRHLEPPTGAVTPDPLPPSGSTAAPPMHGPRAETAADGIRA